MAGLDDVGVARPNVALGPVLVRDVQSPRLNDADVTYLAALGPDDGLHALRPLPTWLERVARGRGAAHPNDIYSRLVRRPGLIGCVEMSRFNTRHRALLVRFLLTAILRLRRSLRRSNIVLRVLNA
jgi:hypothetical protein